MVCCAHPCGEAWRVEGRAAYFCYLLGEPSKLALMEVLVCSGDDEARAEALGLLDTCQGRDRAEIWRGGELVAALRARRTTPH